MSIISASYCLALSEKVKVFKNVRINYAYGNGLTNVRLAGWNGLHYSSLHGLHEGAPMHKINKYRKTSPSGELQRMLNETVKILKIKWGIMVMASGSISTLHRCS